MAEKVVTGEKRLITSPSIDPKRLCVSSPTADGNEKLERIKKRKVVLLLGYCGKGYLGMQRNTGFKTIEEDLIGALKKAALIPDEAFVQMQAIQFQRAARTDKGVSAVRQIVSLKLPETYSAEAINEHLPEVIRVFAARRVTKGFNSKGNCDARTYSYLLPTYAFSTSETLDEGFRITEELLLKIRETLKIYVGTHNYYNFTAKKKASDPSAFRYIMSFECCEPFVIDGLEMVALKVKGQSFMLHQIRKMVGTAIAIVRGLTGPETITRAWTDARLDLPIAPGVGLVLEDVHYDRYNSKFGQDGMHERLLWDEVQPQIDEFRRKYIDSIIIDTEKNEKSMYTWVQTLPFHTYDLREDHVHYSAQQNNEEGKKEEEEVEKTQIQSPECNEKQNAESTTS